MSEPLTARDLLRGQFAYAQSPETYLPGDFTTDYDDVIDRALALASPSLDVEGRVHPGDEVAALVATLRRDDLCDETDGEHHTDEYIARFLVALDAELAGRAALTPKGDTP